MDAGGLTMIKKLKTKKAPYKRKKKPTKKGKGKMSINTKYPKNKKALNKKKGQIGGNTLGSGRTPAGGR